METGATETKAMERVTETGVTKQEAPLPSPYSLYNGLSSFTYCTSTSMISAIHPMWSALERAIGLAM